MLIAPPGSTQLHAGDQLCVIASSAHEKLTAGGKAPPSPWSPARRAAPAEARGFTHAAAAAESLASLEEISLLYRAHSARQAEGRVVLLVGWTRGQGRMLRTLDGRLPPESHVYLLSRRPLKARRQDMAMHGLELHGG